MKVTAIRAHYQLCTLGGICLPRLSDYASHLQKCYIAYSNICAYKMVKTYFRNLFKIHVALLVVLLYLVFFFISCSISVCASLKNVKFSQVLW